MQSYYIYILANKARGTLYIGVTNDLSRRYSVHQASLRNSFTGRYNVRLLVYYEETVDIKAAIAREKQLKNWHRQWKVNLIEESNPTWRDLGLYYRMGPETSSG